MSADLQRIIRIVFKGDNETQKAFGELSRSLDMADGAVRSITKPMAELADNILKAQAAAVTLATGGIALAIQQAGAWSDSFNEISTLTDTTADNLDNFRQQILDYAAGSTASLEDINSAIYAAISAGVDYADSLGVIATSEKLATAGKADLESTTIALVSTMNAYGASMDEAEKYSDILFQTVKNGQTTLPELAASLSSVTSIAAASGVPLETLAAAIATLTAKGMPTTEAMTSIRSAISSIISPTKEASDYAAELGIEFGASALKANGFEGVLMDVYRATGGNVEEVAKLFGNVRGLTGVLAAFGQDGGDAFRTNLESMRNSTGATDEAFAKMAENVAQQTQTMVNAMRATLIQAGLPLLEEFGGGVQALTKIFEGLRFGIQDGAFDPLFNAFNDFIRRVTEFGNEVGEALPEALGMVDWTNLIEGFEELDNALGGIFRALFQDLDPTKPEELAQIIQTMADGLGNLAVASSGIIQAWEPLFRLIGIGVEQFAGISEAQARAGGEALGAAQRFEFLREKFGLFGYPINALVNAFDNLTGNTGALDSQLSLAGGGVDNFRARVESMIGPSDRAGLSLVGTAHAFEGLAQNASDTEAPLQNVVESLEDIPEEKRIALSEMGADDVIAQLQSAGMVIEDIDPELIIQILAATDEQSISDAKTSLNQITDGYETFTIEVDGVTHTFRTKVQEAKEEAEQPIEIETELKFKELDLKAFEAQLKSVDNLVSGYYETIQTGIEWEAKLQIAEVEANAKKVEAIMGTLSTVIESTGDTLGGLFSLWTDADTFDQGQLKRWIDEEMRIRQEAHAKAIEMADAEMAWIQARQAALEKGEGLIQIDGQGLQPHLEAFMFEILSGIQTRANAEGQAFLVGTP